MQEFGINDHKIIERWERIYLEEGSEGLAIERRGRSSKGRSPKQLPKQVEEDLLAEVQRLRAENDYLRNLQALVLEDERRQHKNAGSSKACNPIGVLNGIGFCSETSLLDGRRLISGG